MNIGLVVAAALLVFFALLIWAWRAFSWPCPSWLVPLLENPYFQTVAAASILIERAGVERGMSVLDAGCGPGRLTLELAERVGAEGRVVAVDLQERMLERVRERLEKRGLDNVETVRLGLGEGRLESRGFDVALLVTVLGEIPDREAGVREIARALRPDGRLSITEVLPDPHYQRLARVRELAERVGLEEERVWPSWHGYTINLRRRSTSDEGGGDAQ